MNVKLFFLLCLYSTIGYSQNCNCDKNELLQSIINCDAYIFDNGNSLKWNYDCNASYLIFENKEGSKILFELEAPLLELTGRLGYTYWEEFDKYFIIENKVISGCCDPEEYILFDKINGNKIINFGSLLYETEFHNIYLTSHIENKISILIFDKLDSQYKIHSLQNVNQVYKSLENSNFLFLESLFNVKEIKLDEVIIEVTIYGSDKIKSDLLRVKIPLM